MQNLYLWIIVGAFVVAAVVYFMLRKVGAARPKTPAFLKPGHKLPEFSTLDEQGATVNSSELAGSPAVLLFVRGNWCPFCSKQVEGLTQHYKAISDLGARLIFVTPKPLDTTRRVAEFFKVEFEFWLDESLQTTKQLGLLVPKGVPDSYRGEYGEDTVWPTAIVVDADGVIRFTSLSKFIFDRPDPQLLLKELRKISA